MKTGKSGEARGMWGGIVSFSGFSKNVLFCKLSLAFALIIAESILHIRESEEQALNPVPYFLSSYPGLSSAL